MILHAQIPAVFEPLMQPGLRYLGAYGGRGGAKSFFFAWRMIKRHLMEPGLRSVCIREVQKTLAESVKMLLEDLLNKHGLGEGQGFVVQHDKIRTPGDGLIIFQGMQDQNADNIKSLSGFKIAWVEEAQTLSARSLALLRPTIREEGSQLWFSWNARRKTDPVDMMFRAGNPPSNSALVMTNWRDNPFITSALEAERLDCLANEPDQYQHIWEGDYASILVGAYYSRQIQAAREQHRIGHVVKEALLPLKAAFDIGGTGARSDAVSIWIFQQVGKEVRLLDYYEAQGQPLGTHVAWMRENGYGPEKARIYLPHDGTQNDKVFDVSYKSSLELAGFDVTIIPNQGKGAASSRIEAARRVFPSCWFNEATTGPGLEALGWYHEKQDPARNIGLGPEHDWSSHAADAFGLACIVSESESSLNRWSGEIDYTAMDRTRIC